MRELKFRQAIFNEHGKFDRWHCWGFVADGFLGPIRVRERVGESLQYTSLKDKNGVEIFEGDILEYADISSDEWFMDKEKIVGDVKWRDAKCGFAPQELKQNHRRGHYFSCWDQLLEIEIIGNIHENPELLIK